MGGTTTTRSITGIALGLWMAAAGCTRLNASHCGNQDGDATCRDRGGGTPYCDQCEAANDGCVAEPAARGCGIGDTAVASTSTADSTAIGTTAADPSGDVTTADGVDSAGPGATCGNGILDEGEACDGATLPAGTSCTAAGFGEGEVGCADDCASLDYSTCSEYVECGNGELAADEECDLDNLGGMTCDDFPQLKGPGLACNEQCMLDLSGCLTCRENDQPCDTKSDMCCEAKHECRATLSGPRCCIPNTGDCLVALD